VESIIPMDCLDPVEDDAEENFATTVVFLVVTAYDANSIDQAASTS
jgi:hypothetical protein